MAKNIKSMRLEQLQTVGVAMVAVPFSFQLNGTSAPAAVKGLQVTIARSDTGLQTVTLPGAAASYGAVLIGIPEVTGAKGGGSTSGLQFEAAGNPASGTFQLRIMNAGTTTLVDPAASTTVRVNGVVFMDGTDLRGKNA